MAHIMMAKPIKTLELHYPMIPFLIMYNILYIYIISYLAWWLKFNENCIEVCRLA